MRLTSVPDAKLAQQVAPQLIPEGVLVTVPLPLVVMARTNSDGGTGIGEKLANTFSAVYIVTVHVSVPVQTPPHPAKMNPAAGVAVSVTEVHGG